MYAIAASYSGSDFLPRGLPVVWARGPVTILAVAKSLVEVEQ
jgi:hypothetical protein